jgi:alpha-ribazole phosphatase
MMFYLIRHPEPRDAHGRCYGREDIFVAAESFASAAASIRAQIPARVLADAEIFSSPVSRCLTLARHLAAPRSPEIADDLIEMDFGLWEGKSWDTVPREQVDAWAADVWGYRPGDGECAGMVAQRWRRWGAALPASGGPGAVALTHGGLIRVALACEGRLGADEFVGTSIGFGSVHAIELEDAEVRSCAVP